MRYLPELESNWGFLLEHVRRLHTKRFEQRSKALGVTLSECRALVSLSHQEGTTQVRLAVLTDVEPTTMVRMLDRMESVGWLERRRDPANRRVRQLYFKPKGSALLGEIQALHYLTYKETFADVPTKDMEEFMAVLAKIHKNLISLEPILAVPDLPSRRDTPTRRKLRP